MKRWAIRPGATALAIAVILWSCLPGSIRGREDAANAPPATDRQEAAEVPAGMVRRELPLGFANLESLKETLPDLLSPDGKYVVLELSRVIRITDHPRNIEAVREMISALSVPPKNVRIEVTALSIGTSQTTGGIVRGRVPVAPGRGVQGGFITNRPVPGNTPGVIRRETINGRPVTGGVVRGGTINGQPVPGPVQSGGRIVLPRGGLDIGIGGVAQQGGTASLVQQFILVQSGATGTLEVVREVPLVDYFTRHFAGTTGYIIRGPGNVVQTIQAGGTFEVPEFRWEKAGAQLLVRPTVHGNLITVDVMPQISAVVIANPAKFRNREINTHLTGADQYVQYTRLKTSVTVANGATVTIGGFTNAPPEFNRHFFGYGRSTSGGSGSITLRATIE